MQISNLHVSSCVQNVYVCLHVSHTFSTRLSPRRDPQSRPTKNTVSARRFLNKRLDSCISVEIK